MAPTERRQITVRGASKMQTETLIGLILKGKEDKLREIVHSLEKQKDIQIMFVKWPKYRDPFLLIIEIEKRRKS
jgi:hypothetical protein